MHHRRSTHMAIPASASSSCSFPDLLAAMVSSQPPRNCPPVQTDHSQKQQQRQQQQQQQVRTIHSRVCIGGHEAHA